MKDVGFVVIYDRLCILLFPYWNPSKPCTVVENKKLMLYSELFQCKAANMNTLRA